MFDSKLYDIYIERMCKFDSTMVEAYLKTSASYNLESAYAVSQQIETVSLSVFVISRQQATLNCNLISVGKA